MRLDLASGMRFNNYTGTAMVFFVQKDIMIRYWAREFGILKP